MRLFIKCLVVASLTFMLSGCLVAQPGGTSGRVIVQDENVSIDVAFTDHDRQLIREHYRYQNAGKQKKKYKNKNIPPGLAKQGKLSPGIKKQLVRKGRFPDGVAYQRFPVELERKLSRIPGDFMRVIVDGEFVLLNRNTRVIFDIFHSL